VIPPSVGHWWATEIKATEMTKQKIDEVSNGDSVLWAYGRIDYEDAINQEPEKKQHGHHILRYRRLETAKFFE
jgi:hypothetical protein